MHMPVELGDRLVLELRRAAALLLGRAGRDVIRPGQIVVGNRRQVDVAVVPVRRAAIVRCLVERRADVEMRSGYDPFTYLMWVACLPANRAVVLGVGFVPVLRGKELPSQIPELARLGCEFFQHSYDFL